MKWQKPSPAIISTFENIIFPVAGIERCKMFGLPCTFVNSNMFRGLHRENIFIWLSESDREVFLKLAGAHLFEPIPGRRMKEYVVLPQWMLDKGTDIISGWVYKSFGYAASLPVKEKKVKK